MHGEVTDEYTTLIQVFRAVHTVCVGVWVCMWGDGRERDGTWLLTSTTVYST